MTKQTDQQQQQPVQPTGDEVMTAARDAAAEVWPDAAPTASDHANRVANMLIDALNGRR